MPILLSGRGCACAQPGEGRLALEEEHAAELDAAGDLAAAGALVEPAFPGLRSLRGRQLGYELVEREQPGGRRRLGRWAWGDPLRELLGEPWCQRFGEQIDGRRSVSALGQGVRRRNEDLLPVLQGELAEGGGVGVPCVCHHSAPQVGTRELGSITATEDTKRSRP